MQSHIDSDITQNPDPQLTPLAERMRPRDLNDFVGQKKTLSNLVTYIQGAKKRDEVLDHLKEYYAGLTEKVEVKMQGAASGDDM